MLLRWTGTAERDGFSFAVAPGGPDVMRVVDLAGALDRLEIAPARRFERR
jgi:hypothetical protein